MNGCCNDCGITFGKTECLQEHYEATSMPVFTIFAPAAAAKRGDKGDRNHFRQQNGTLAQLVQSIALTGQGSLVRVQYVRSEEHTSELQSLMRISYAVFCLKKKNKNIPYKYNIL